ncbi:hypothetical protein DFH94DRAFT_780937 [Russula ochroleuca]|uniref:DUF6533 domain-containing protein n=1 Tax=Russula ochroleuca TaxID=152965 RepID=A0A9P5MQG1_9AGAM|nr:hypothetical protein DFH94DRAFT_780937 [Russula ochroleuca]
MLSLIPLVILYYDYNLTFSSEVESFWPHRNRLGFVSSVYFLNRYVAVFGHIPIVLKLLVLESFFINERCRRMHQYIGYLGMVLQFLVAKLVAQVYALYNKNRCIFTGLIALMIASIAVGIVAISTELEDAPAPAPGCNFDLGLSNEGGRLLSFAWSGIMTFDIIVFALTVYKGIRFGYKVPLIQVLIRDVCPSASFTWSIGTSHTPEFPQTLLKNFCTPFTNVLSTTLVSRTMLRLRSDDNQRHRDLRVTEQTTDLSGELPTTPTAMTGNGDDEDSLKNWAEAR